MTTNDAFRILTSGINWEIFIPGIILAIVSVIHIIDHHNKHRDK